MNWINTDIFSHQKHFPARQYAASFLSPPEGNTAINTLPTWSFFQADQHQFTDPTNSERSVLSIASFAIKRLTDAYLANSRMRQARELYPAALGPTQTRILKPQSHNRWLQLTKPITSYKGGKYV